MKFKFLAMLKPVYSLALLKLKLFGYLIGVRVWARHSYLDTSFEPIKSDLDITIYSNDAKKLLTFHKFYTNLKLFIPFLGELSSYDSHSVLILKKNTLNSLEINRDPILLQKFLPEYNSTQSNHAECFVFLQQTFMNDYAHLRNKNYSRKIKWQKHFDTINSSLAKANKLNPYLHFDSNNIQHSILNALMYLSRVPTGSEIIEANNFMFCLELTRQNFYRWDSIYLEQFKKILYYFPDYIRNFSGPFKIENEFYNNLLIENIKWSVLINIRKAHCLKNIKLAQVELNGLSGMLDQLLINNSAYKSNLTHTQLVVNEAISLLGSREVLFSK